MASVNIYTRRMSMILNLTQHQPSPEQVKAGVINPPIEEWMIVKNLMTFETLPSVEEVKERAIDIASIAADLASGEDRGDGQGFCLFAMIGGAPFFMSALETALLNAGITPIYAFSVRESIEKDGVKTSVFKHIGFVGV